MENEEKRKAFINNTTGEGFDEFEQEASIGWKNKKDNFDDIMHRIDNRIESTYPLKEKSDNVRSFAWVKYAAAAVVIGISSLFSAWYFSSPNLGKELYAAHFETFKNKENTIRGNSDMGEILTWEQKANYDYQKGNYASAETNYEKILETEPNNSKTMVFLAVSYLNTDKPEKAIDLLSKYVPEGSRYDEDIQWYLALAYLKTEQKGTAKLLLEGLRDKKGFYKDQSALILSKL
jgi:predicted Zn-dependent protease